jgi:non-canonical (house-cleaning) NTP pyrophosphatase
MADLVGALRLARQSIENNLAFLQDLRKIPLEAQIVKFGRTLGTPSQPACQDVVIRLAAEHVAQPIDTRRSDHDIGVRVAMSADM